MSYIGMSVERIDAKDKVTGNALYPGDFNMPNQAYMKVLFTTRIHAIIKKVDISKAEALEGVIAIYTAKDVPVNEYGLIFQTNQSYAAQGRANPTPIMCAAWETK